MTRVAATLAVTKLAGDERRRWPIAVCMVADKPSAEQNEKRSMRRAVRRKKPETKHRFSSCFTCGGRGSQPASHAAATRLGWVKRQVARSFPALASAGGRADGAARAAADVKGAYGAALVIDGRYEERWIATGNELRITLARPERIDRVVFSSDRLRALD